MTRGRTHLAVLAAALAVGAGANACTIEVHGPDEPTREPSSETTPGESTEDDVQEIAGANRFETCDDRDVVVTGSEAVVTLSGACGAVTVEGPGALVTLESAERLEISADDAVVTVDALGTAVLDGDGNQLLYGAGLDGGAAAVDDRGQGNSLTQIQLPTD